MVMIVLVNKYSHTLLLCGDSNSNTIDGSNGDGDDGGGAVAAIYLFRSFTFMLVKIVKHNGVCFVVSTQNPVSFFGITGIRALTL